MFFSSRLADGRTDGRRAVQVEHVYWMWRNWSKVSARKRERSSLVDDYDYDVVGGGGGGSSNVFYVGINIRVHYFWLAGMARTVKWYKS